MLAIAPETLVIGTAAAVVVTVAVLITIAATIDRHASVAELKIETYRVRRSRLRPVR
ncbi:MAG: hypothetical protein U0572_13750 [Phycisphaerales bacterium]